MIQTRLFLMMLLQLAIWGAYMPKLFPYMGQLGFEAWQQSLVGSAWGIASILMYNPLQGQGATAKGAEQAQVIGGPGDHERVAARVGHDRHALAELLGASAGEDPGPARPAAEHAARTGERRDRR